MKILLVDDNVSRISKVIDYLTGVAGVPRDSIVDRRTALDARQYLSTEHVDLLVLDLLLPYRVEDSPSLEASLNLLTEISETDALIKPTKIIGLTAYAEAATEAAADFIERTWTIIPTDDTKDDWLETLANCARYVINESEQSQPLRFEIDLLIICALRSEMEAIYRLPWDWQSEEPADDNNFVRKASVAKDGKAYSIVAAIADRMGMTSTAVLASKLITQYRPRLCVMPGICAAVRGRAEIGDVVLADDCWDYQSGKHVVDDQHVSGFEIDPHHIGVDQMITSRVTQLASDSGLFHSIWKEWQSPPSRPPRLLRGPVASGSAVLADNSATKSIVAQQRKVMAIEMELYGLYLAAASSRRPKCLAFGMKAVCDFADAEKHDGFQAYAAYTSARVLHAFVDRYLADICRHL